MNAQESFGCTALHYAATYSDVETCRAIIAHSGNVNLADNTGAAHVLRVVARERSNSDITEYHNY